MLTETGLAETVRCHAIGLSDRDGTVALAENMHSFLTHVAADGKGRKVPVARLDGLGLPDPDLIKLDVEGHEPQVLRGAEATLARAKPLIAFENWPAQLEPLGILESLGYRFLRLVWTGESEGRLDLVPLQIAERDGIEGALNLLALPPDREALLRQAF